MRYPRLLVVEKDGFLARLLGPLAKAHDWSLREPRRLEACLRLLARGGPAVVILKVDVAGDDTGAWTLTRNMTLLERVKRLYPEAAVAVVFSKRAVTGVELAWDLGADCVLAMPVAFEQLPAVVEGLMRSRAQ